MFQLVYIILFLLSTHSIKAQVSPMETLENGDLMDLAHRNEAVKSYDTLTKYLATYEEIKAHCQKMQELQNRFSSTTGKVLGLSVPLLLAPNLNDYLRLSQQKDFTYIRPKGIGETWHAIRHPFLTRNDLRKKENFFKYLNQFYELTEDLIWVAQKRYKKEYINHTHVHLLLMQQATLAESLRQIGEELNRHTRNFNNTLKP